MRKAIRFQFTPILSVLPRSVKSVIHFQAIGSVGTKQVHYRVKVGGRSLAWLSRPMLFLGCTVFGYELLDTVEGGGLVNGSAHTRGFGNYQVVTVRRYV